MKTFFRSIMVLLLISILAACGNKGPLVKKDSPSESPASTTESSDKMDFE